MGGIKKGPQLKLQPFEEMAERTGFEPAASGVTGRRYNQLNYRSANVEWAEQGSNL